MRVSLILFFLALSLQANSQNGPIAEVILDDPIANYSMDQKGNLYIGHESGTVSKYSKDLDTLFSFSPAKSRPMDVLEAWHGFKIFCFYQQFQEYAILDQYLSREVRYSLSFNAIDYVDMATVSADENLWLIDQNEFHLIKYNTTLREPETVIPLEFIFDPQNNAISFMQEYQNLLFIVDTLSGIYIFDNFGNYLNKIGVKGLEKCSFLDSNIVYMNKSNLTIKRIV